MAMISLKKLYYSIVESDKATATTYGTLVKIDNAVSVDISPNITTTQFYGDDMAVAADV